MKSFKIFLKEKKNVTYNFSSAQINFNDPIQSDIIDFSNSILDDDIYIDPKDPSYGREDNPHVTIKYGIHSVDPDDIIPIVKDVDKIEIELDDLDKFSSENYDVLIIKVKSVDLHKLNKMISVGTKVTNTFPNYTPHATIAYLKKDTANKYIEDYKEKFKGLKGVFDRIEFSGLDGNKTIIKLGNS